MSANAFDRLTVLDGRPWIALDTETTGTGPHDQVVEIALVERDGEVLLDTPVRPDRPVPRTATAIHGLDGKRLAGAPTWSQVWPQVRDHLLGRPVLAWNAAFDIRLIRQTCNRFHQPFRLSRFTCLREAFEWRFPKSRATLAAACLALGIADRPQHRARPDAEIARQVALRLVETDPVAAQAL